MAAGQYGGYTQGILLENGAHHNYIDHNTIRNMRRGLYLYQTSSSSKSAHRQPRQVQPVPRQLGRRLSSGTAGPAGRARARCRSPGTSTPGNLYAIQSEGATSGKTFDHETIYDSRPASGLGAVYLKGSGGKVSLRNSIIRTSTAYGVRADSGSTLTISYSTVYGAKSGTRSGSVSWSSATNKTSDPKFLSTIRTSADYLTIGPASPVYAAGSAKDPIGARAN